jgi:hypothetical protein
MDLHIPAVEEAVVVQALSVGLRVAARLEMVGLVRLLVLPGLL